MLGILPQVPQPGSAGASGNMDGTSQKLSTASEPAGLNRGSVPPSLLITSCPSFLGIQGRVGSGLEKHLLTPERAAETGTCFQAVLWN